MKDTSNRCVRKNFDKNGGVICKECFQRDLLIDSLREELKTAKSKIQYLENNKKKKITRKDIAIEGAHTPSAAKQFKTNSSLENQLKKGGALLGHKGFGRTSDGAIEIEAVLPMPKDCPCCKTPLATKDSICRTYVDVSPAQALRKKIKVKRGQCPNCKRTFRAPLPLLKKALYGNQLLTQSLVMHYVHGISIGRILEVLGPEVTKGGLINSFHYFGSLCAPARDSLIAKLKTEEVRNADETGWRTDGQSGFAWIFRSQNITIFEHCDSRSAKVPKDILGERSLDGFLVVDRYNGYNKVPVKIQYCYAHLLREVKKLEKDFPDDKEIHQFSRRMGSHLRDAMNLQRIDMIEENYLISAAAIKRAILKEINYPYGHLAIKYIQQIFIKQRLRLYHWVENPRVPADNNRAEREIRSTVIARKTSFGSQSKRGAKTRSNIMSVLLTAKKKIKNNSLEAWLFHTLNSIAKNPELKIIDLLPRD